MFSKYRLQVFLITWVMIIQGTSSFYICPASCKCNSRNIFCIGDGIISIPNGVPWNKTIVYIRNYRMKNETLSSEDTEGNNVTRSLYLQRLGINNIEDGSFELFRRLVILNLNENKLRSLRNHMFKGLQQLRTLYVTKNLLMEIDIHCDQFPMLSGIDLSYNNISNASWILKFEKGKRYYRGLNSCKRFSPGKIVRLNNNPLADIYVDDEDDELINLSKLTLLNIGLQRIPYIDMRIFNLDLSYNNIVTIMPFDMIKVGGRYKTLMILSLNNNNLAKVAPRAFIRGGRLRGLYLENNALKTIPKYLPYTLHSLYMSNNQITDIESFLFVRMSNLNQLVLKNNKICSFTPCSFCGLVRLFVLSLERNCISTLPEQGFIEMRWLRTLSLSGNSIRRMESGCFVGLRNLKEMDLSFINNNIDIDEDVFDPLGTLEKLFIQSSPHLARMFLGSHRALSALKNLDHLDVSHNKILSLKQDISMFLPRLISMDISGNQWRCNDDNELIMKFVTARTHVFVHTDIIDLCAREKY